MSFDRGGLLEDGKQYGFYTKDGKIPLPVGTRVIVFTISEAKNQILFDQEEFVSSEKNNLRLSPKMLTRQEFNSIVKKMNLEKVDIVANDSKNAVRIRKTDAKIKDKKKLLETYRPKNCSCSCGAREPKDTALSISSSVFR